LVAGTWNEVDGFSALFWNTNLIWSHVSCHFFHIRVCSPIQLHHSDYCHHCCSWHALQGHLVFVACHRRWWFYTLGVSMQGNGLWRTSESNQSCFTDCYRRIASVFVTLDFVTLTAVMEGAGSLTLYSIIIVKTVSIILLPW
jgi:hypothetical protein